MEEATMRRLFLTRMLVGMMLAAGATSAASAGQKSWPDTLFAEREHDFGPVPRGAKVRHPFVLTNNTENPISIVSLRVSCGCTSGKANVAVVPPGKTGIVEAEMDTRNFVGRKATTLYVTVHNGTEEAEIALNVASTILADIVLNPGGIDFGSIVKGQSPTLSLTIDRVGQPDWRVVKMVSSTKVLSATLAETARGNGMVSYRLDISIKPNAPSGTVRDEIQLLTNDPESKGFPVLVTAQIRGELTATPGVLSLGTPSSAEPVKGSYIVRSSRPFKITDIQGSGDGYTATIDSRDARPLHVVTVTFKPEDGKPITAPSRTFKIATDLPGEQPVVVSATLQGVQ
jgi:hypothetical protein